ncbi:MAG: hypothetical protein F4188_02005, partial [Chloroflexi bacterium]|nr:hypothetical protein [Chloroflexota bacterium]
MSEPSADAATVEEFAASQGLRVDDSGGFRGAVRWFVGFMSQKRLGAAGVLLVFFWSVIAVGTVGDGGGWLGVGRYDSRDVFEIASATYADDKLANALDGMDEDVSDSSLREIVSDPEIFGAAAIDQGVAGEMVDYALNHVQEGTLLSQLVDEEQIEIRGGTIHDVDALLATGTDNPLTAASLQGPSSKHWLGT